MGKIKNRKRLYLGLSALFCTAFVFSLPKHDIRTGLSPSETQPEGLVWTSEPDSGAKRDANGRVVTSDDRHDAAPWSIVKSDSPTLPQPKRIIASKRPGLQTKEFVVIDDTLYPRRTYAALFTPNDPLGSQSWVSNTNLTAFWDVPSGAYETTLAIIDTGFALGHEEFQGRWHQNEFEVGLAVSENPSKLNCTDRALTLDYSCNLVDDNVDGIVDNESGAAPYENASQLNCTTRGIPLDKACNLVDDDSNSYVDDVRGWDMINQDNSPQAGELSPNGAGTTHGSMVAGVAAASGNNSVGIAGVDWATKILPIQALDDDDYGDTFTVGKAIYYAIEQRADVINISLGTMSNDTYVRQAIEAATAAGILVVASSGNDGCECVAYPARYPEVLAVGATDQSNVITYFSSWGSSVDLVAPGTNYTVPSWSQANPTDRYVSGVAGTSFSSPLVAGIATRLKSLQPQASPLHLIAALRETATRTPPADIAHYGFGRADAAVASGRMTESNHSSISYNFTPVFAGTYFGGGSLEKPVDYSAVHCQNVATSTRIYEAIKGSERFYTISEVEKRKAESLGFTVPVFAQVCLEQPHDTKDTVRHLNIFREFRNLNTHL